MKILFLGDVVGRPGRRAVTEFLPGFRKSHRVDFAIVNAENCAGGKGVTHSTAEELFKAGADVLTGGNHTFANNEAAELLANDTQLLRPANLPPETPGRGLGIYKVAGGVKVAVLNLMGRAFMKPIDCPFRVGMELAEEALRETPILITDFHAEATSEKIAMASWLDAKATAVIGTHTHVPSADARISPAGTAAITDSGMTGPYESVIGVKTDIIFRQLIVGMPVRHQIAGGGVRVCGVLIELDAQTGRAISIESIREPDFETLRPQPQPDDTGEEDQPSE